MILDTSAVLAVVYDEPDGPAVLAVLQADDVECAIGTPTLVELTTVVDMRRSAELVRALSDFLKSQRVRVIPFTESHAQAARDAYARFGRGTGHPARLNFGDCLAYAAAKEAGEPLLCIGNDFRQTDLEIRP